MECGHLFCTQCWTDYLTTKIVDDGMVTFSCPGNCKIIVDDKMVMFI